MDASKFIFPAEKRLDLSGITGKSDGADFVTLKVIPIKVRYQIDLAKTKGIAFGKVREILQDDNKTSLTEDDIRKIISSGRMTEVMTPEYDGGIEAKILTLVYAVDQTEHSFTTNGKPLKLDRAFWEGLGAANPKLFEFIFDELTKYQGEMALGETIGN